MNKMNKMNIHMKKMEFHFVLPIKKHINNANSSSKHHEASHRWFHREKKGLLLSFYLTKIKNWTNKMSGVTDSREILNILYHLQFK